MKELKFTLVFPSHESRDLSIGCLFTPCLKWAWGRTTLKVPHPEQPHYLVGDFHELLQLSEIAPHLPDRGSIILVVIHAEGHGTKEDLNRLLADIQDASYRVKCLTF